MSQKIIGRREEIRQLKKALGSKEAEFVAVYGRRRVGKTYLIRNVVEASRVQFIEVIGQKDGDTSRQLEIFADSFGKAFGLGFTPATPTSWKAAFEMLTQVVETMPKSKKLVIFLDELPWLATPKSGLLQALDHTWNAQWVKNPRVKLIVCGSAASWMLDNLVNAKGGLHNRLTARIRLKPFNFQETIEYLSMRSVRMDPAQVLNLYLAIGGIPFYLNEVQRGLSVSQNINQICFTADGLLYEEFDRLYSSLFNNSDAYIEIIRIMAKRPQGMDQASLEKNLKLTSRGGTLTKRLNELEAAGFIISFIPYGYAKKGVYYRIIDEYTLFYIKWIEPSLNLIKLATAGDDYWQSKSETASWNAWSGYAFEAFCYKHIANIIKAMKIRASFEIGTWRYIPKSKSEKGVQIDLLLDRSDGIINIVEIKYSQTPFRISKQYSEQLADKIDIFHEKHAVKKSIHLTMVTAAGLRENEYSREFVENEITLEDFCR